MNVSLQEIEIVIAALGSILGIAGVAIWRVSAAKKDLDEAKKHCAEVPAIRVEVGHMRKDLERIRDWKHDVVNKWLQVFVEEHGRRRRGSTPDLELSFDDVEDTRNGERK